MDYAKGKAIEWASDTSKQNENQSNNQDSAKETDTTVTKAIAIATKATRKAT